MITLFQEAKENPNDNVESFDAVWYSALQVVITATANGVKWCLSTAVGHLLIYITINSGRR
jgi:hypothetical protein